MKIWEWLAIYYNGYKDIYAKKTIFRIFYEKSLHQNIISDSHKGSRLAPLTLSYNCDDSWKVYYFSYFNYLHMILLWYNEDLAAYSHWRDGVAFDTFTFHERPHVSNDGYTLRRRKKTKLYSTICYISISIHPWNTWYSWSLREKIRILICLYTIFPHETKLTYKEGYEEWLNNAKTITYKQSQISYIT